MITRRRSFPLGLQSSFPFLILALMIGFGSFVSPAKACWNQIVRECFDSQISAWPWDPPGVGRWTICSIVGSNRTCWQAPATSTINRWGIQNIYYSTLQCDDQQGLWCMGLPNNYDPRFDTYVANLNDYVAYGPFPLTNAVAARCLFELMNYSEVSHDSVFWGADTVYQLNPATVNISGSRWGIPPDHSFQIYHMDLSKLRNIQTGDTISLIGRPNVYVFWWFRSDGNQVRDIGAFIDNVIVSWDDGTKDLDALALYPIHPEDSTEWQRPLVLHDTTAFVFRFQACDGGDSLYPPFHVIATLDDTLLMDTVLTQMVSGSTVQLITKSWPIDSAGLHHVRFVLDSLDDVTESDETNNAKDYFYYIRPPNTRPVFQWVTPSIESDTLWVPDTAIVRWRCFDPDSDATIDLAYDNDRLGCVGPPIPGGTGITLTDNSLDTLIWVTRLLTPNRFFYPMARVRDSETDTCIYADRPIYVGQRPSAVDPQTNGVPTVYYLQQNYPNPFNPTTSFHYGVAKAGMVTLKIYDLLGREAATVVNENLSPGSYTAQFDGSRFASGIYIYKLSAPEGTLSRKMMLLK